MVPVLGREGGERKDSRNWKMQDDSLPGAKDAGASSSSLGCTALVDRYIIDLHKSTRQGGLEAFWETLAAAGELPAAVLPACLCSAPCSSPGHERDVGSLASLLGLPTRVLTGGFWLLLPSIWAEQNVFVKAFICSNKTHKQRAEPRWV